MTSPNRVGGKLPDTSQEASTARPTQGAAANEHLSDRTSAVVADERDIRQAEPVEVLADQPGSGRSALGFITRRCAPGGRVGATHRYPGGRPAITSFHKLASSLRPALSLRRQRAARCRAPAIA